MSTHTARVVEPDEEIIELIAAAGACWYLEAQFHGQTISMLVDTGAAYTLLSRELYERIGEHVKLPLGPSGKKLRAANGGLMSVHGVMESTISIGEKEFTQEVIVADLGGLPSILGSDFMRKYQALFDVGQGVLTLPGVQVELYHQRDRDHIALVRTSELVNIGSGEMMYTVGYSQGLCATDFTCSESKENPVLFLEPAGEILGTLGLMLVESVTVGTNPVVPLCLYNPGCDDVEIEAGVVVAGIQAISSKEVYQLGTPDLPQSEALRETNDQATRSIGLEYVSCNEGNEFPCAGVAESMEPQQAPDSVTNQGPVTGTGDTLPEHLQPLIMELPEELPAAQKALVEKLLWEFQDIFAGPNTPLGQTSLTEHFIDTGTSRPIRSPLRRAPEAQKPIIEEEVKKMLDQGVIEPCNSPWASNILLVRKKDSTWRFCIDFRRVNDVTRKDAFPLPSISDHLDALSGSQWYCSLDMISGYWQVPIAEVDRTKTAFITHCGLFQHRTMAFGLCNAPATFSRLVQAVFQPIQGEDCVLYYLDDVAVHGKDFFSTLGHLRRAFACLRAATLQLKAKKCHLFQKELLFLGHTVSSKGIGTDPTKIEAVQEWEVPRNLRQLRSFLGFTSYYRRFIPSYSTMASPLTALTKKGDGTSGQRHVKLRLMV